MYKVIPPEPFVDCQMWLLEHEQFALRVYELDSGGRLYEFMHLQDSVHEYLRQEADEAIEQAGYGECGRCPLCECYLSYEDLESPFEYCLQCAPLELNYEEDV